MAYCPFFATRTAQWTLTVWTSVYMGYSSVWRFFFLGIYSISVSAEAGFFSFIPGITLFSKPLDFHQF